MELSEIKAFLAVAEELHFGRAAVRLNISQPPLSRTIRSLEEKEGAELFQRTSRAVRITPAGEALRREALEIVAKVDKALTAARNASSLSEGNVSIGFVGAATYSFLPRLAPLLRDKAPGLSVRFIEAVSNTQIELLRMSRLDLALLRPVDGTQSFANMVVERESLALAIPIDHPLARRQRPRLGMLDDQPFIGFSSEASYLRGLVANTLRSAGVRPNVIQEFAQSHAILSLVSAGVGVALVPEKTAQACFDNVVFRSLHPTEDPFRRNEGVDLLAMWDVSSTNPALQLVLRVLYEL